MQERRVIELQRDFYRQGGTGCLFAAHAATDPEKFGWKFTVVGRLNDGEIRDIVQDAISAPEISTQSILFPTVVTEGNLADLLRFMQECSVFKLEQEKVFGELTCLGYRVSVGSQLSWVMGLADFEFLPKTRQAVFTEIAFRSKKRPGYKRVMKKAPPNVLHLADMDVRPMRAAKFKALWYGSFDRTEQLISHKPNLASASKTTFAVPKRVWRK